MNIAARRVKFCNSVIFL